MLTAMKKMENFSLANCGIRERSSGPHGLPGHAMLACPIMYDKLTNAPDESVTRQRGEAP